MIGYNIQQINQLYRDLSGGKSFDEAKLFFQQLKIQNFTTGDLYFQTYGVGNVIESTHLPYERFVCYEYLLSEIKQLDERKYYSLHKGTPFYFLAWTAFLLKDYEKAVFYMDAAIAEDMKLTGVPWSERPMGLILTLSERTDHPAVKLVIEMRQLIESVRNDFNSACSKNLSRDDFVNNFVVGLINKNKGYRSIVSSLYSYIFEFNDRIKILELRSKEGGTIEPILTHLFKGALLFESLLKYLASKYNWKVKVKNNKTKTPKTLGDFNNCKNFTNKFCKFNTSSNSLREIIVKAVNNKMQTVFSTTAMIRNTTGHNLVWDDVFNDLSKYHLLYKQTIYSLFYLIDSGF